MGSGLNFLLHISWDGDSEEPFRAFATEKKARRWIELEHERRWDAERNQFQVEKKRVQTKTGRLTLNESIGFEVADLYRILSSGKLRRIAQYQTYADKRGVAVGWLEEHERKRRTTRTLVGL